MIRSSTLDSAPHASVSSAVAKISRPRCYIQNGALTFRKYKWNAFYWFDFIMHHDWVHAILSAGHKKGQGRKFYNREIPTRRIIGGNTTKLNSSHEDMESPCLSIWEKPQLSKGIVKENQIVKSYQNQIKSTLLYGQWRSLCMKENHHYKTINRDRQK